VTHEELLKKLWEKRNSLCDHLDIHFALSKVAELHKPDGGLCNHCEEGFIMGSIPVVYPCPTIQAIEKELV